MSKICYVSKKFSKASQKVIDDSNSIIAEYQAKGFILTLRQLFYQHVSRGLLENTVKSYKNLGGVVNDARLAGLLDWNAIEDRTRNLVSPSTWKSPANIISASASCFRIDKWADQEWRPEVWIEKEALAGVFERACEDLQVPFFCCRGYTSQSEMWSAGQRLARWKNRFLQTPIILHFGDHDPSGIDMSRDIEDRLRLFGLT